MFITIMCVCMHTYSLNESMPLGVTLFLQSHTMYSKHHYQAWETSFQFAHQGSSRTPKTLQVVEVTSSKLMLRCYIAEDRHTLDRGLGGIKLDQPTSLYLMHHNDHNRCDTGTYILEITSSYYSELQDCSIGENSYFTLLNLVNDLWLGRWRTQK